MAFKKITDIKNITLKRISTGIPDLDWIYDGDENSSEWGLPNGKISLWAGVKGVGKSRATIEIARSLTRQYRKVIYFQGETDLSSFRNWVGEENDFISNNFLISDSFSLDEQRKDIKRSLPNVVIVDSVNRIEEFGSGVKSNINKIYEAYKDAIQYVQSQGVEIHIIFLCQINKDGSTKGSSDLGHLVDTEIDITFWDDPAMIGHMPGCFIIKNTKKHRNGRIGDDKLCYWTHHSKKAVCDSCERIKDKKWCDSHDVYYDDPNKIKKVEEPKKKVVRQSKFEHFLSRARWYLDIENK
jgi:hypothetical protein